MTVYLVLEQYYEDLDIHGIFSSREKAEAYIQEKPQVRKDCQIEEYELDSPGVVA